ncbi:MAG: hypothetical protein IKJ43_01435 [Bacilli bacterium]|nr:hypothetical protein [Bacilli bacterium]
MDEITKFEDEILHGKYTIENFEAKYLKNIVWQYYKAKITTDRTIGVLDSKIQKSGFFSLKKSAFVNCKDFLQDLYAQMNNANVEFNAIENLIDNSPEKVQTLQELLFDDDHKMTMAMHILSCYCKAKGLGAQELLSVYPIKEYLEEIGDEDLMQKYGIQERGVKR